MPMRQVLTFALLLALVPVTASAVTIQDIVAMSKAGVSEQVLIALIEHDRTVFSLDGSQLVALKNAGVSEAVVLAMLRANPGPPAESIDSGGSPPMLDIVIVGHGPDRPNTYHEYDALGLAAPLVGGGIVYSLPYVVPYGISGSASEPCIPSSPSISTWMAAPPAGGIFFTNPDPARGIFFSKPPVSSPVQGAGAGAPGCAPVSRPSKHHRRR